MGTRRDLRSATDGLARAGELIDEADDLMTSMVLGDRDEERAGLLLGLAQVRINLFEAMNGVKA